MTDKKEAIFIEDDENYFDLPRDVECESSRARPLPGSIVHIQLNCIYMPLQIKGKFTVYQDSEWGQFISDHGQIITAHKREIHHASS